MPALRTRAGFVEPFGKEATTVRKARGHARICRCFRRRRLRVWGRAIIPARMTTEVVAITLSQLFLVFDPEPLRQRMDRLHHQLRLGRDTELKFAALGNQAKFAALAAIDSLDLEVHAVVVEKSLIKAPRLRNSGIQFRQEFVTQLLCTRRTPLSNAFVIVDKIEDNGANEEQFREDLLRRMNLEEVRAKSLRFVGSHKNRLLQVADICAGAIRWDYERKSPEYKRLIASKIVNEWRFK